MLVEALQGLLTLVCFGFATKIVYDVFLGPLSSFPGPKLWAASRLPWCIENISGRLAYTLDQLHSKYGPIVRIGPDELSFAPTSLDVWRTIYAHRPIEMPKSLGGHGIPPPASGVPGISTADEENHARIRRAISPAFSEKALREQQTFFQIYIDELMRKLDSVAGQEPVDLVQYFNWTTFDIIGDLAFGESFGGLDNATYHPWILNILQTIKAIPFIQFVVYYRLTPIMRWLMPKKVKEGYKAYFDLGRKKVDARLARDQDRKDFVNYILAGQNPDAHLSREEIYNTCLTFILAGSETSATMLSGTVFYVLQNDAVWQRLRDEIRDAFNNENEISMVTVEWLVYLNAVVQESFRMYPPAPATIPRVTPGRGEIIDGRFVPGGTVVGINQWSTYRSKTNFHDADSFRPERWLSGVSRPFEFENDSREVLQPFSYGPRNCVGQRLANAEIRLILCRLIWKFDLELCTTEAWHDQKVYLTWDKKPLMVRLEKRHD